MKSLAESIFDKDLVSKDTGLEYIYGLVEYAWVKSSYYIPFFDERKIKHEFNKLSKDFEMQQWNVNKFCGMDRYQNMDTDEMLRELLYIIVTKVKSTCIKNPNTLRNAITKVINEYADLKNPYYLDIMMDKSIKMIVCIIIIYGFVKIVRLKKVGH
jgi:hypothetical protein